MSKLLLLFQSKVALAIIGTVLFGGGAALVAVTPFNSPANQTPTPQLRTQAGTSVLVSDGATPTTATASRTPTASPTPRAPTGSGQTILHGAVGSVNTNARTFTLISNGVTKTVVVTNSTTFHNGLRSLSDLYSGLQVIVRGTNQPDGAFLATSVSQPDN